MNFETVFYPSFEWGGGKELEQLVSSAHFTLRPDHLSTRDIFFFLHNYLPEPDFVILTNCISSTARVRPQRETIRPFSLQSSGRHVIA